MRKQSPSGFTLIEVLIVLVLLGFLASTALTKFNRKESMKSVIRNMSVTFKKTRGLAKLKGQTYRFVIHMDEKEEDTYWVESSSQTFLIDSKADDRFKITLDKDKEKAKNPGGFERASDVLSEPKELPKEWKFGSVETTGHKDSLTQGDAYIYFFPEGLSEEAVLQITNKNDTTWTLHLKPLIGAPDVYQEAKALKDFQQ